MKSREEGIRKIWQGNALMQVLKIEIEHVEEGYAVLSMPIDFDIHTNHWLGVHGGALASLADSACGIACASVGKIVQTLNINITYISNTKNMGRIFAKSEVVHAGQTTMNLHTRIEDDQGTFMCEVSTIMFVSGDLDHML